MTTQTLNGAMVFDTADAMIAAMFGPPQHDRLLTPYRWRKFCLDTYGFDPFDRSKSLNMSHAGDAR